MLDAALDLIARNINPVPVSYPSEKSRGKNPIAGEGWQNVVIIPETAPQYFANGKDQPRRNDGGAIRMA